MWSMPLAFMYAAHARGAVGGTVVAHDLLDADPAVREPEDRPLEEPDGGRGPFVGEDLDVGQTSGVVDRDVDGLPAGATVVAARASAPGPVARPVEPAEFLDIDMHQLAGVAAAVPVGRLGWPELEEAVQPQAAQNRTHRRGRHRQGGRDLGTG